VLPTSVIPAVKFLGVFIDPNLNFKFHINHIVSKISKSLYFLRQSKHFLTPSALQSLYYSLIHCHLIYALPVWSCTYKSYLTSIIQIQKRAIRIISLSHYNSHTEPIFKQLKILPFEKLIECTILQFMQQFVNGFLPNSYDNEWLTNASIRGEDLPLLRNQDDLHIPFSRVNYVERLPLIVFPKLWSNFSTLEIKFIRDKTEFKLKLKKHLLNELSSSVSCTRLLCPRCHLNQ
jgi:hypothetical protein